MWAGLLIGIFTGTLLGIHYHERLAGSPSSGMIWMVITAGFGFVAFLPDAVAQIVIGIRRFKAAAR